MPRASARSGLLVLAVAALSAPTLLSSEFRVNTYTTQAQNGPAIGSDQTGHFVVVWNGSAQDGDGLGVLVQEFNEDGSPDGPEFRINAYTTGNQNSPAAALAEVGSGFYIVAWESLQPEDGSSTGIFAKVNFVSGGGGAGPAFRVNTYTSAQQQAPAAARVSGSDFVVVWRSYGQDGSSHGIYAQRLDVSGFTRGPEFRVNTYTTFAQLAPAIASNGSGGFVVAWQSFQDGSFESVHAQRFDAVGSSLGTEFRANTVTTNHQRNPAIAENAAGAFVVAWQSDTDASGDGVFAQLFTVSGAPIAGEFRVNTYTTGAQTYPSAAALSSGDFVISWQGLGDGSFSGVFAQRVSASGLPLGGELPVNSFTLGEQTEPAIARGLGGGFVAVWDSLSQDGSVNGIFGAQVVFDPPTDPTDLRVNTYTTTGQVEGSVAIGPGGSFVIAWTSVSGQDGSSNGVFAQRFGAGGAPSGDEFRVNTYTTGNQRLAQAAFLANGAFVVAWGQTGVNVDNDVFAQRFGATGAPLGGELRVNTLTGSFQGYPALAGSSAGFLLAWKTNDGNDVAAQRFSAAGAPLGGEFRVNTTTTSTQNYPAIGLAPSGDFVIAWQTFGTEDDVVAQRFAASGAPLGGEFRVNTYTSGEQVVPSTAVQPSGDFVIVWGGRYGAEFQVRGQRFAAAGQPLGPEFRVNTYPTGTTSIFVNQTIAQAAASESGFTVVWNTGPNDSSAVLARRFGTDGASIGPEFRVDGSLSTNVSFTSIAEESGGSFVIAYTMLDGSTGPSLDVFRRRFASLLRGDVDGNGVVNVTDVLYLINNLFAGGPAPVGEADADANGTVNVSDVLFLINYLFAGGPAPS